MAEVEDTPGVEETPQEQLQETDTKVEERGKETRVEENREIVDRESHGEEAVAVPAEDRMLQEEDKPVDVIPKKENSIRSKAVGAERKKPPKKRKLRNSPPRRDRSRSRSRDRGYERRVPMTHSRGKRPDVQIVLMGSQQRRYSQYIQDLIGNAGLWAEIRMPERQPLKTIMSLARDAGIEFIVIVGKDNEAAQTCALKILNDPGKLISIEVFGLTL
jgi:hypothetical protein